MPRLADNNAIIMWSYINEAREEFGLDPLLLEIHLNDAASRHSEYMGENNILSHTGQGNSSVRDRVEDSEFDLSGSWRVSENVGLIQGMGMLDAGVIERGHFGFMNSVDHYANIMDPDMHYVGISVHQVRVVEQDDIEIPTVFFTIKFASTSGDAVVQDPENGDLLYYNDRSFIGHHDQIDETEEVHFDNCDSRSKVTVADESVGDDCDDHDKQVALDEEREGEEQERLDEKEDDGNSVTSGACFIATAAYGDRMHPDVAALRRFRDVVLLQTRLGRAVNTVYIFAGRRLARYVTPDAVLSRAIRAILSPVSRMLDPGMEVKVLDQACAAFFCSDNELTRGNELAGRTAGLRIHNQQDTTAPRQQADRNRSVQRS